MVIDVTYLNEASNNKIDNLNKLSKDSKDKLFDFLKNEYKDVFEYTESLIMKNANIKKFFKKSSHSFYVESFDCVAADLCDFNVPDQMDKRDDIASVFKSELSSIKKSLQEKYKNLNLKYFSMTPYGYYYSMTDILYNIKKGYKTDIGIVLYIPISKCKKFMKDMENKQFNNNYNGLEKMNDDYYKTTNAKFLGHPVYIEINSIDDMTILSKSLERNINILNSLFNDKYKDKYYDCLAKEANSSDETDFWNNSNIKSKVKEEIYYIFKNDNDFYVQILASCHCKDAFGAEFNLKIKNGKDSFSLDYTDSI